MKHAFSKICLALALGGNALLAADLQITASSELPTGHRVLAVEASGEPGNNICKWSPDGPPGKRRNLGQIFSTVNHPFTLAKVVLRLAPIREAIGADTPGAAFTFRLVRFASAAAEEPEAAPVLEASGALPDDLMPDQYLVLNLPPTALEPGIYGFEIGFASPAPERKMNFNTSGRGDYPQGRAYHLSDISDGKTLAFERRPSNLEFYLFGE